jgi:hypothetical protein
MVVCVALDVVVDVLLPPRLWSQLLIPILCSRAAAADELLGMYSASVEGYAKAADLLLYLLTPMPGLPADIKPALDHQECAKVYR